MSSKKSSKTAAPAPQEARRARYNPAYAEALGAHVEHVVARLFIRPGGDGPNGATKYVIAGAALGALPLNAAGHEEMWEADIVIIPRRRWRRFAEKTGLRPCRIDQILNGGFNEEDIYLEVVPVVEGEENWKQEPQPNPALHEHYQQEVRRRRKRK